MNVKLCVIFANLRLKLYTAQPKTANPFSTSELHCHLRFKPHGGKVHLINNFLYPQNMMEIVYSCFAESEVFSRNVEFLNKVSWRVNVYKMLRLPPTLNLHPASAPQSVRKCSHQNPSLLSVLQTARQLYRHSYLTKNDFVNLFV